MKLPTLTWWEIGMLALCVAVWAACLSIVFDVREVTDALRAVGVIKQKEKQ